MCESNSFFSHKLFFYRENDLWLSLFYTLFTLSCLSLSSGSFFSMTSSRSRWSLGDDVDVIYAAAGLKGRSGGVALSLIVGHLGVLTLILAKSPTSSSSFASSQPMSALGKNSRLGSNGIEPDRTKEFFGSNLDSGGLVAGARWVSFSLDLSLCSKFSFYQFLRTGDQSQSQLWLGGLEPKLFPCLSLIATLMDCKEETGWNQNGPD